MDLENRISGFANANGEKFESANSAYKSFINASGDEETPEAKPDFKKFLETAKQTGVLDKMLKKTGVKKEDKEEVDPAPEKKKFTLTTTHIVGIVIGVAVIGTVIYFATRKKKQATA
jgi:hypothetical protein